MNGSTLALGLVGALAGAAALRRGSLNTKLRVSVVPREVFEEAFREEEGHLNVICVAGLPGRGLLMLDVQDMLRDRIEDSGDEEAVLDHLYGQLREVARFFDGLTFPLTVYRGVLLSGPAQTTLNRQQIGRHWTPSPHIALRFARGEHDASERQRRAGDVPTLLTGQISSPLKVDWRVTFAQYLGYSLEDFPGGVEPQEEIWSQNVSLVKAQEI